MRRESSGAALRWKIKKKAWLRLFKSEIQNGKISNKSSD